MSRSKLLVRFRMATSIDDLKSVFFWRSVIAEALGTLLLVFAQTIVATLMPKQNAIWTTGL
jgi:hypothetical protein